MPFIETVLAALPGWQLIISVTLLIAFLIIGGAISFKILNKQFWNFKYICMEKIPPFGWIPTKRGKMRLIGFGDGGEEVFYLKKLKKARAAYGIRIGNNEVLWVIHNGIWYNSNFDEFDVKLRKLGIMPIDRDMRYTNSALRKGFKDRKMGDLTGMMGQVADKLSQAIDKTGGQTLASSGFKPA